MRPTGWVSGHSALYTHLPVPMYRPITKAGSAGGYGHGRIIFRISVIRYNTTGLRITGAHIVRVAIRRDHAARTIAVVGKFTNRIGYDLGWERAR